MRNSEEDRKGRTVNLLREVVERLREGLDLLLARGDILVLRALRTRSIVGLDLAAKLLPARSKRLGEFDLEKRLATCELRGRLLAQVPQESWKGPHLGRRLGKIDEALLELVLVVDEAGDLPLLGVGKLLLHLRLELRLVRRTLHLEVANARLKFLQRRLEPRDPRPLRRLLLLRAMHGSDHRLSLLLDVREFALDKLDLAEQLRRLLIEAGQRRLRLGENFGVLLGVRLPLLETLDGVEAGALVVVVTSSERSLAVVLVAVESDRVEVVAASVGSGDFEGLADDRLGEDLLEREGELLVEGELLDPGSVRRQLRVWRRERRDGHRDGVLASRVLDSLSLEAVERDKGNATALVLDHDFEDLGRRLVVVDDDLEETAKPNQLPSDGNGVNPPTSCLQ